MISPFHPASNGFVEQAVRSAKEALGRMGPREWHERIAEYLLVQHTTPCQSTNQSPAELLMGLRFRTTLNRLHPQYAQSRPLDSTKTNWAFSVGDYVYSWNYGGQPLWLPGKIAEVLGPCSYRMDLGQGHLWHCHSDQLRAKWVVPAQLQESDGLELGSNMREPINLVVGEGDRPKERKPVSLRDGITMGPDPLGGSIEEEAKQSPMRTRVWVRWNHCKVRALGGQAGSGGNRPICKTMHAQSKWKGV